MKVSLTKHLSRTICIVVETDSTAVFTTTPFNNNINYTLTDKSPSREHEHVVNFSFFKCIFSSKNRPINLKAHLRLTPLVELYYFYFCKRVN